MTGSVIVVAALFAMGIAVTLSAAKAKSPTPCTLDVQPKISLAPSRYVRVKVIVEPSDVWRAADVTLYDPDGFVVRVSRACVQTDGTKLAARTTNIEWPTVGLFDDGEYQAR